MQEKYKLLVEDIYYYVSSPWIFKNYPMEKAIEAVQKNSPLVLNFLKAQHWTFSFVPFRKDDSDALVDRLFFTVDFKNKEIFMHMHTLLPSNLLEHYLLYASLYVYEESVGYSITDSTLFQASMAMEIKQFVEYMDEVVERQISVFEENGVEDDVFFDILRFEYFSNKKYLYASYSKLCLESEEMKNRCAYTSNVLEGVLW